MKFKLLALAVFAFASSLGSIQVMHPKDLKKKLKNDGFIKTSLGNFGHIMYGSSILGRVYYPLNNTDGCRPYRNEDFPPSFFADEESDLNPIIMADRGNCSFVSKVRNIERQGVKLAIINDNLEEDSSNLIMSDDGTGHSINIPSFIIGKKESDLIKASLLKSKDQKVYIKAELEVAHPDNRVEYEFWYSTILDIEFDKLVDMALFQKALNKNALFTPRVLSYGCGHCAKQIKEENCIADGNYCPYMPSSPMPPHMQGITGKQFIEESLRQRCLYEVISKDSSQNQNFTQWFNYALRFID